MPERIYNAQWAKENISMPELLGRFGHEPVKLANQGGEYWYISPFRYEKEPSFHTSYLGGKWIWNDFGRGDVAGSGTVIGFLEMHENVNVSGALQILKNLFPHVGSPVSVEDLKSTPLFKGMEISAHKSQKTQSPQESLTILEVNEQIWDKRLIGYLAGERGINHKLALKYLKHIKYKNLKTGKTYDTLGFENDSGDYECRDKYFKGILKAPNSENISAAKDITYIPGRDKSSLAIFEGFMDFLSVLTRKREAALAPDVVILNMINMRRRAIDFIKQSSYQQIYTFFDNDSAGQKTTEMFLQEFGQIVKPQNHLYEGFKDFNQKLKQ